MRCVASVIPAAGIEPPNHLYSSDEIETTEDGGYFEARWSIPYPQLYEAVIRPRHCGGEISTTYDGAAQVRTLTPKPKMKRPAINWPFTFEDDITAEPVWASAIKTFGTYRHRYDSINYRGILSTRLQTCQLDGPIYQQLALQPKVLPCHPLYLKFG